MTNGSDDWQPYHNGFVKGHIGVFPAVPDAWAVWDNFSGEWRKSEPFIAAARNGRTHTPGGDPPFHFWERTREETIAEAKRLAEKWLAERTR
jgi:hypothetical protein